MIPRLASLWHNLVHQDRVEHDLDDEVDGMFALIVDEQLRAGKTLQEARHTATLALGGVGALKEQVRLARTGATVQALVQDIRYAVRLLRKSPGVTTVILLTLALGIGVNTAIFSFVDGILLKPLPYPHADRIVGIWERTPSGQPNSMTTLNFLDYARQNTVFERIAATTICCDRIMLSGGVTPEPLAALKVSPSYFDILGATAASGRTFIPGDDQPGRDHVVVLSHKEWVSQFGSDPTLIGHAIRLNNEPYTVIGIMPANGPFDRTYIQVWLPLAFGPDTMNRTSHWLLHLTGGALGLLKPGVTLEQARAEMETIGARLSAEYPSTNKGWSAVLQPYATIVVGPDLRQSLYLLLAAVGLVLLIGCVNVANLMLARALAREREISVRLALGASRGRLIRQFLTESLLIASLGGLIGILVAYETTAVLKTTLAELAVTTAMLPVLIPAEASIVLDWRVLSFATALSLVSGLAFGFVPAVATIRGRRASGGSPRQTDTAVTHRRLRDALIVMEVALACVLLVNAGLLIRSFFNLRHADTGFDATNVVSAMLPVRAHRFADAGALHGFMHQIVASLRELPGVSDAAFTDGLPMEGAPTGAFFQIASHPLLERAQRPVADRRLVSPAYFGVLGLRLRRGRTLSERDRDGAPLVTVINDTMARQYFANDDPIGQRLLMEAPGFGPVYSGESSPFEIVGVIADERLRPVGDTRERAAVYVSTEQDERGFCCVVIRTALDPSRIEPMLRQQIAAVDRDQPVRRVMTIDQLKSESLIPDRLRSAMLGLFAAIALALSAIGIYGVIAYSVVQRTREIGIRAALGASPANLVRLVVGRGMTLAALGLCFGCVGALAVTRLVRSFLFGVESFDPVTLMAAVGMLAGVAAVACYIPGRHAAQVDPLNALRAE